MKKFDPFLRPWLEVEVVLVLMRLFMIGIGILAQMVIPFLSENVVKLCKKAIALSVERWWVEEIID